MTQKRYLCTNMNNIINDILSPDITLWGAVCKLVLSLLLGAMIGFERRLKGQSAGLRTFALIAMGATLVMLISIYIPQQYLGMKNGDPGRIAAQVVSGVGFLGAGAIIQMKGSVRGLTTAAGIWMAACIGLAVGAGMYVLAVVTTLLILFVLVNIERLEHRVGFLWETRIVCVKVRGIVRDLGTMRDILTQSGVRISNEFVKYDYEENVSVVNFLIRVKGTQTIPEAFDRLHEHYDLASIALTNELSN